jgi:hypothetical protein
MRRPQVHSPCEDMAFPVKWRKYGTWAIFAPFHRESLLAGLWLVKQIAYATSAKRLMPSMVRNALRAMRRRRKRTFNSLVFHPIGS